MRSVGKHWSSRLARRRARLCVDGKGGWRKQLTAIEYFVCLVDGLPYETDPWKILDSVNAYEDGWLFGPDVPWEISLGEAPEYSLRDYVWMHSKQLVPRCVAYSVPDRFPWEVEYAMRRLGRRPSECDCVLSDDEIPF